MLSGLRFLFIVVVAFMASRQKTGVYFVYGLVIVWGYRYVQCTVHIYQWFEQLLYYLCPE